MSGAQFRQALADGDLEALRGIWASAMPHLPQPSREAAEIAMHRARTETGSLPLRPRAYSHRWLTERGHESGLPDRLKQPAERLYPRVVEAVGYSFTIQSPIFRPAGQVIQDAVCGAIEDIYADAASPEVPMVKARMAEVRDLTIRREFGWATVPHSAGPVAR